MIDLKSELQDYKKINIEEIIAGGQKIPDNIKNSIILYNKAIDSISNGSEDIAMIELKKSVALNPHFYEALNLLGVCYNHINDNDKAAEIFDRVIKGESNGVKAQKYLDTVKSPEKETQKNGAVKRKTQASPSFSSLQNKAAVKKSSAADKRIKVIQYAVCFAAGALLVVIINLAANGNDAGTLTKSTDAASNSSATEQQTDYKSQYEQIDNKYKQLQIDLESANKKVTYYQSAMKLSEVESLSANKQYENAAEMLILLKTVEFTGTESEKFNTLSKSVMPEAALTAYNEGVALYSSRKYEEALGKLDKVQLYDTSFSRNDSVLYYIGKSYQQLKDTRNAIAAFQKLIDTYPKSTYVKRASDRIKALSA